MASSLKNNKSEKGKKCNIKQSSIDKKTEPSNIKKDYVQEEPLSPTKKTINMFEELSSSYLISERPLNSKNTGEIKYDTVSTIGDISGSVQNINTEDKQTIGECVNNNQKEYTQEISVEDKQTIGEFKDNNQKEYTQNNNTEDKQTIGEFTDNNQKEYIKTYKAIRESTTPDLIQYVMDNPELTPSEVSVDDLNEKMKEILSIPLPEDSNDTELKEDEIDKLHEENMKILKQKLHLNTVKMEVDNDSLNNENNSIPEKSIPYTVKTVEMANNITATITETKAKPIPRSKSTSPVLSKCNIEEARKIYTRQRPNSRGRQKSIIQHTVIDLTSEILQINSNPVKIPKSTIEENPLIVMKDDAYNMYYKERELIEMAKKEKIEPENSEIDIEYIENTVKKGGNSFFRRMISIFTCGLA